MSIGPNGASDLESAYSPQSLVGCAFLRTPPGRPGNAFAGLKILILKPSSLGDLVQALPVLRMLRRHLPAAKIYWWVDAHLSPLLEGDPDLDGVVLFERHRWASPLHWPEAWRSLRQIRAMRYDWVIDLQALARSGILAWLSGARLTIGLEDLREGAAAFYDLCVPRISFHLHAVDWYLSVLAPLGVPVRWDFDWLPVRPAVAAGLRKRWPLDRANWIALQPGARWLNKRWPVENYTALVSLLARERSGLRFAILGGPAERTLAEQVCAAEPSRCLNLAGQTSLAEMVEWIRFCCLMVTNDSGPMHVAAALRKPVVAIFGPTEPRRTGPYGQIGQALQQPLPCVPCLKSRCLHSPPLECLQSMPVTRVHDAVVRRLAELP